jgi:hypothetical protein
MVPTKGLEKAEVLRALWNDSKPIGLGIINPQVKAGDMTLAQARDIIRESKVLFFDYGNGKCVQVDLTHPEGFDETVYDRTLSAGAAHRAIEELKVTA